MIFKDNMSSADKRASLKERFLLLSQSKVLPSSDNKWWAPLCSIPHDVSEINEVFNGKDIRIVRDSNKINFIMFVRYLANRIVKDVRTINLSLERTTEMKELLNSIRILTRLIPFLYELPDYFEKLERTIFWSKDFKSSQILHKEMIILEDPVQDIDYLGAKLIESLFTMLSIQGFSDTFGDIESNGSYISGLKTRNTQSELILESDRTEVLNLILTLCLTSLYERPNKIVDQGSTFLSFIVSKVDKKALAVLVEFLLKVACKYPLSLITQDTNAEEHASIIELKNLYATYSIELLTVMVVYPFPEGSNDLNELDSPNRKQYNYVRHIVAKLDNESELLFVASSFMNLLKHPLKDGDNRYFLGRTHSKPSIWAVELTILLWEIIQCNKEFRTLVSKIYLDELLVVQLFYVTTFYNDDAYKNLVRICSYFLLYLSSGTLDLEKVFEPIRQSFYETLPSNLKLNLKSVTTRDFVVIQIAQLLISLPDNSKTVSNLLLTTLVEILYNLIPLVSERNMIENNDPGKRLNNVNYKGGLGYSCCISINQLIAKYSSRTFILSDSSHSDLLALLIRAICAAATKYSIPSRMLLLSILKNEKLYHSLKSTIYNLSSQYFNEEGILESQDHQSENDTTDGIPLLSDSTGGLFDSNDGQMTHENSDDKYFDFDPKTSKDIFDDYESHLTDSCISLDLKGDDDDDDHKIDFLGPDLPTGMSKRSREKLPKNSPLRRSWGGNDSLRILLDIIIPNMKLSLRENLTVSEVKSLDGTELLHYIQKIDYNRIISERRSQISYDFLPETPIDTLKFKWSHLSLGWYVSLLYSEIHNSIDRIESYLGNNTLMKNVSSTFFSLSKFTSGWGSSKNQISSNPTVEWLNTRHPYVSNWAFTNIVLFKVSDSSDGLLSTINRLNSIAVPGTPNSINDMANNMVRRISDFRINSGGRNSVISTGTDERDSISTHPRNSVSSLHSINSTYKPKSGNRVNSLCE